MYRQPLADLLLTVTLLAVVGCGQSVVPGQQPPGTGFIAFIRANDVWVVAADGSGAAQLTTDGATDPYRDPAVAPDGTIYALRGEDTLYRFDVTGRLVTQPVPLAVLENGGEGLEVASDGAHLAFVTTGWGIEIDPRFGTRTGTYIYGGTDVIGPDGRSVAGAAMGSMLFPTWLDASTLVVGDGVWIYSAATGVPPVPWLGISDGCVMESGCPPGAEAQANFARPVVNRNQTLIAYQYEPYFGTAGRRIGRMSGPPPAPVSVACLIPGQENHADSGSLSADGSLFAFDDTVFDPDTFETRGGQGVWVMAVDPDAPDCGASTARLIAPGGYQPDFS